MNTKIMDEMFKSFLARGDNANIARLKSLSLAMDQINLDLHPNHISTPKLDEVLVGVISETSLKCLFVVFQEYRLRITKLLNQINRSDQVSLETLKSFKAELDELVDRRDYACTLLVASIVDDIPHLKQMRGKLVLRLGSNWEIYLVSNKSISNELMRNPSIITVHMIPCELEVSEGADQGGNKDGVFSIIGPPSNN